MFFVLGLLLSTALYGAISLSVYLIVFQQSISELITIALNPSGWSEFFIAYMVWSVPVFIILFIIHILLCKITDYYDGLGIHTSLSISTILSWLWADMTNPFRGLFAFVGAKSTIDSKGFWSFIDWGSVFLHFLWAVALIVWIFWGFYVSF